MPQPLILPMIAHVVLTAFLYALLTAARAPKVWGLGRRAAVSEQWAMVERRISANLSNQFEWPLLFYVACLLLTMNRAADATVVLLAWLFVAGRVAHSFVQIVLNNVRLRGVVFMINFLSVLGLWLVLLRSA